MRRHLPTALLAALISLAAWSLLSTDALASPTEPVIHGVVDTPTGPAGSVGVYVFQADGGPEIVSTETDSGGNYSLEVPGDFEVTVAFIPHPDGPGTTGPNLLPTFYTAGGGTVFEEDAEAFVLEGTKAYVVNEVLLAGGEIAGTVRDTVTKAPLAGQIVTLESHGVQFLKTTTAANGDFQFVRLDSKLNGDYRICFAPPLEEIYSPYCEEQTANPATSIFDEPPLVMNGTIAGALDTPSGTTFEGEVEVAAYTEAGTLVFANVYSGNYVLPLPPGRYKLYIETPGLPAQYYRGKASLACAETLGVSSEVVTHAAPVVLSATPPTCSSGGGETPPGCPPSPSPPAPPPPPGPPLGGGSPSGASASAITSALSRAIAGVPSRATVATILKAGAISLPFAAPSAGAAAISWYELPPGAHLSAHAKPSPVLIASGHAAFAKPTTAKIRLTLTAAGRRLLRSARHSISLVALGSFTPTGGKAVKQSRHLTLRRGSTPGR